MSGYTTYPSRSLAERILSEAENCNPGPWADHSRICATCAQKIAEKCGMDGDKAYVLGLLHDIGRKFGIQHLGHVYDGYQYMLELGYTDVARVCLTHSFCVKTIDAYIGKSDIRPEEQSHLLEILHGVEYDDYDLLIQLCDCLAGAGKIMDMEERMLDVKHRYGYYPLKKWNRNMELKQYFQGKCGEDLYRIVCLEGRKS